MLFFARLQAEGTGPVAQSSRGFCGIVQNQGELVAEWVSGVSTLLSGGDAEARLGGLGG